MSALSARREKAVGASDIARWCKTHFGLSGQVQLLAGEIDLNARLTLADGRAIVAKLSHAGEDPAVLDLQATALRRIAEKAPALPVPRLLPALGGRDAALVETPSGEKRLLRCLSWLDGVPLSAAPITSKTRQAVGALSAQLVLALAGLVHPAEHRPLRWSMPQAAGLHVLLGQLEAPMQALVKPVFHRFVAEFLPRIGTFRAGIIHHDLNLHNLLADPADTNRLTGCIDFGDLCHAPFIVDHAVAAAYQADPADPVGSIIEMARAFHAILPLTADEMDWLADLCAMRAAMTVIITHFSSRQDPANAPYLLRNEPQASALLAALAGLPREKTRGRIRDELGAA
jgi:hydroxylysine kinase